MNVHEYQAKAILKDYGIPVPRGHAAFTPEEAVSVAKELGGGIAVVKAQIHAGGRGKGRFKEPEAGEKGGVRIAKSIDDVRLFADQMLTNTLETVQTGPQGRVVKRLLIEEGAQVEFFSPLRGERPDANAAGVYLGGGYPELHGSALASNTGLWSALKDLHAAEAPIYAECGGFMVLTEALTDTEGHRWPMAGLLPGFARMSGKLAALGYRHATALRSNLLADPGDSLRGHEFRYSSWVRDADTADETAAWQVRGTRGDTPIDTVGYARGNLLASYLHVHFGQRRELATRFVGRLTRRV